MAMLDVLKGRLPEGLSIVKTKDRSNASQMKVWFAYEGTEVLGYLPKTCTPGYAEHVCDMTVCTVMMKVGFERNDLDMVNIWNEKQNALCLSE